MFTEAVQASCDTLCNVESETGRVEQLLEQNSHIIVLDNILQGHREAVFHRMLAVLVDPNVK